MNTLIKSIEEEYRRYKALAEAALEQVSEQTLSEPGHAGGNSLAVICWVNPVVQTAPIRPIAPVPN